MRRLTPDEINRIAAEPAHQGRMELLAPIDLARPFVPEAYTQLYYTPIYATLSDRHRLRYNQLFALRINEYIMMLEADLIERLLPALRRRPAVRDDPALMTAVATMRDEERRHYAGFAALNRACRPDLYPAGQDRYFSLLPWWTQGMFSAVGAMSPYLPFALWYLMAMEESAKSMAREMARRPDTQTLGPLEPGFTSIHLEHLKDETRHLHIDALLIEQCLQGRWQGANAWLFKQMLEGVVRPTRAGSGAKVVRQLVRESPELAPRENEMIDALIGLRHNEAFQASLFNRRIMPETFRLFDRCPAFADLNQRMVGYDRSNAA